MHWECTRHSHPGILRSCTASAKSEPRQSATNLGKLLDQVVVLEEDRACKRQKQVLDDAQPGCALLITINTRQYQQNSSPLEPTVREELLFQTGAPELVVK